jgi:hypothetical protein
MEKTNPTQRLVQGKNIWNLVIIDNIDFEEKTFKFDVFTRESSYATLRMAFQIQLPIDIRNGPEEVVELTADTPLFGMNPEIDKTFKNFSSSTSKNIRFNLISIFNSL